MVTDVLQNTKQIARWLGDAKFYHSRYKPVPIEEHLVFDNAVYPAASSNKFYQTATKLANTQAAATDEIASHLELRPSRTIQPSPSKELSAPLTNAVVALANETARSGYGALVFCSSRAGCERDAILISQVMPRPEEVDSLVRQKRAELLADLRSTSTGLDSVLEKTVPVGVVFHRKCRSSPGITT